MKAIVIGNGLAGTMAAKTLRELDAGVEVVVFAEEKYPYYPRPNLIEYVAGKLPYERLFAFPAEWHVRQKLDIRLGTPVRKVHPASREVELDGGKREACDVLLVANGASSFFPPIKGLDKKGVFALRTLDDAQAIIDHVRAHPRAAVIGGGLLGLEIARAIRSRGAEVEVVEFFDRLLPRQLDAEGAAVLRGQVEGSGIKVRLGVITEEILGQNDAAGIRLKGGAEVGADTVIIAAGVRPNLDLARDAGLAIDRGLVIDDRLQTSHQVFAAGDGVQHRGKLYGIIPASFDQARAAAYNMLGQERKYEGTTPSTTLKVAGLYVTSLGLANPEGPGYEEIRRVKKEEGAYKKIVLQDGVLVGAVWMGTKKGVTEIARAVAARAKVNQWKNTLLEDSFDFSVL
jgi:nitrite reductase (NADH) large subunit